MPGGLSRFLAEDHARLDGLLREVISEKDGGAVNHLVDAQFRAGLLRHIKMEEKILLPFLLDKRQGDPLPVAQKIRLDHGALASLLVPTPTPRIIAMIRTILEDHNSIEEGAGGLYETCEALAGAEVNALIDRMRSVPDVRVAPHIDSARGLESTRLAVEKAEFRLDVSERPPTSPRGHDSDGPSSKDK